MNLGALPLLPSLQAALRRVDDCLLATVAAHNPALNDAARHLINAGGKRLRPTLTIASALTGADKAGELEVNQDVILAASAMELIHLGSLHHDDVLDDAAFRRGVPSVNAKWGNFMAIISGDYLLAKASGLAARIGIEATNLMAQTIAELCEGQVLEQQSAFSVDRTRENYENSIAGKTASLLSAACRLGAQTQGLGRAHSEALANFGQAFGIAFQIRDDILDVIGSDDQLGKPSGKDVVEGIYNLPVILALQDPSAAEQLRRMLGHTLDLDERDEVLDIVRKTQGPSEAYAIGESWSQKAQSALNTIPETEMVGHLRTLAKKLFEELDADQLAK